MKTKLLLALCIVLGATAAVALLQNLQLRKDAAKPPPPPVKIVETVAVAAPPAPVATASPSYDNSADTARIKVLETENAELLARLDERDRLLMERDERIAALSAGAADTNRTERRWGGRRDDGAPRDANPEEARQRAEERAQQWAETQERLKTASTEQTTFLKSIDVSRWPAELQENHAKLLETITYFNGLIDRPEAMMNPEGGAEARQEMFTRMREVGDLMEAERNMLHLDLAQQLELDEAESKQFVDYLQAVQNATSARGYMPFGGGRPGGRGTPRDGGGND